MPLSDDDYHFLQNLLEGLEPEIKKLPSRSQDFVRDQLDRFHKYGQDMFMSQPQWNWLKDLYEKNVGSLDQARSKGKDEDEPEIPF